LPDSERAWRCRTVKELELDELHDNTPDDLFSEASKMSLSALNDC